MIEVKEVYWKSPTSNGSCCCPSLITINTNTLFWSNIHFMKDNMLYHDQYECCFWSGSRNWSYWYEAYKRKIEFCAHQPLESEEEGSFPSPDQPGSPQPAAGEAICSPTPHYLSLFGGRFHSCVHMFPVKQYNQVNQIYMSSVSLEIIFACFYVFVYDRCSIFLINWKGRWHVERHRQVFSWVFPCFPSSSSSFPVFYPPTKHFQTPGASIEEWRQLFQYLMCLICFVSIACNHT